MTKSFHILEKQSLRYTNERIHKDMKPQSKNKIKIKKKASHSSREHNNLNKQIRDCRTGSILIWEKQAQKIKN